MPDEKFNTNYNDPEAIPGVICKVASVSSLEATDEDLKKINKYTLEPVGKEDVFVFKATMADNEQDDRNYMPFNLKALMDLKKLYIGKTMLKDHSRRADNQIARVYDTEIVQDPSKKTELGELHTELIAKIYVLKLDSNKDLIAEIKGGIKKEVSTSCKADKMICNICNGDGRKCIHWPGLEYTIQDGTPTGTKKRCKILLDGAKEAYELSFVAVPAQPRAGTHKSIGFAKLADEPENAKNGTENTENGTKNTETENQNEKMDARIFAQRVKNAESFFNANKEREEN